MRIPISEISMMSTGTRNLDGQSNYCCEIVLVSGHSITVDTGMYTTIVTDEKHIGGGYVLIEPLPND